MAEIINVELEQEVELQTSYELSGGIIPTGTKQITIDASGTTTEDVTNYANAEITVPQGQYKPQLSTTITPSISVSNSGLITASNLTQVLQDWTKDTFTEGYVESSNVSAKATVTGGSATRQLNTVNGQTVTPTTSQQSIAVQGDYVLGAINVAPIPSQYIVPTGTKSITDNGTGIDVKNYEFVDVNVSGGGGGMDIGQANPSANLLAMLKAIYNGTAKTGTFTRTDRLTQNTTQIFDADDTTVKNFVLFVEGWGASTSTTDSTVYFYNLFWLDTGDSAHPFVFGTKGFLRTDGNNSITSFQRGDKDYSIATGTENFNYAKWEFTNGVLSVKAQYNKNATYSPFNINTTYRWIAW